MKKNYSKAYLRAKLREILGKDRVRSLVIAPNVLLADRFREYMSM